jgi:hypothetical protein
MAIGRDLGAQQVLVHDTAAETRGPAERDGGRGGIRTHERVAPLAVFKTAALNHSATRPIQLYQYICRPFAKNICGFCHRIATLRSVDSCRGFAVLRVPDALAEAEPTPASIG